MHELDIENSLRKKTYDWFKSFKNPTYGINVTMDVTELVNYSKETKTSFFINMLYIVVNGLNSVPGMRMRFVDNKPVIFDDINPAITVMTENYVFENVRFENKKNYQDFYNLAKKNIDEAKYETKLTENNYNPTKAWNEYYITCLPWLNFTGANQPMTEELHSQTVPRICWGKYVNNNGKYEMTLNITVSHIFVDGLHISKAFNKIQELLDEATKVLK